MKKDCVLRCLFACTGALFCLLFSSCSSTRVEQVGQDGLQIKHRGKTDAVASVWTIKGAWQGAVVPAERLESVHVSGVGGTSFGAEEVNPQRNLQGFIDRSNPQEVVIEVRQRGLGRWNNWAVNGTHAYIDVEEDIFVAQTQEISEIDSAAQVAGTNEQEETKEQEKSLWNPLNWLSLF